MFGGTGTCINIKLFSLHNLPKVFKIGLFRGNLRGVPDKVVLYEVVITDSHVSAYFRLERKVTV